MMDMAELAKNYKGKPLSAKEMVRRHHIPRFYLEQLLVKLRRGGLIESVRGPQGGFTLKKNPAKITMGEIIRSLEGPLDLVSCAGLGKGKSCWKINSCLTRSIWLDLNDAVNKVLQKKTLADLIR
jgi:Rrf2 family protein